MKQYKFHIISPDSKYVKNDILDANAYKEFEELLSAYTSTGFEIKQIVPLPNTKFHQILILMEKEE